MTDHRTLTPRGFYGYAAIIGLASAMQMAWALIDIWTIAPRGIDFVAGLGLSDVVNAILMAMSFGIVDLHAAQLARAEGTRALTAHYSSYLVALVSVLVICTAPALALEWATPILLTLAHQPHDSIGIAASNFSVRALFFPICVLYLAVPMTLRIMGRRNTALVCIAAASAVKLVSNGLIRDGNFQSLPIEQAVAYATVIAQLTAVLVGFVSIFCIRSMGQLPRIRFQKTVVKASFWDISRHAPALAVWNMNDYLSSFAVLLLLGQAGATVLAAANIASKITTLFYRLPQACCEAAFVYYGYVASDLVKIRQTAVAAIIRYSVTPTLIAAIALWSIAPTIVVALLDVDQPVPLAAAVFIVRTHCIFAAAYVIQHLFAQFLTIERRTKFLLVTSAVNTYGFVIPTSFFCFVVLDSWQLMVACERFSVLLLALANVFWLANVHVARPRSYFARREDTGRIVQ